MAKNLEFYKGKRKKRNYALIPFIVVLGIVALLVVTFYATQKYAVITKDGVSVELPLLKGEEDTAVDSEGNVVKVFDPVDPQLVFDQPDYSKVKATAGKNVPEMRAIFVPAENITAEKLDEYAQRLKQGNALVLEMKPRSGVLMWNSNATQVLEYGLSTPTELTNSMPELIAGLKEKGVYLVAQISCCLDELFPSRSTRVALCTPIGSNFKDDKGYWLDPFSLVVRNYVVELTEELYELGFDEVVLADVRHPVVEQKEGADPYEFIYTREMSTTPNPVTGVCGFAMAVADQLSDRKGLLSIYCYSATALVKSDETTGQNAVLFMKLFDRVYYPTERGLYSYAVTDMTNSVTNGSVNERLVPVITGDIADNNSWVMIDLPQAEN